MKSPSASHQAIGHKTDLITHRRRYKAAKSSARWSRSEEVLDHEEYVKVVTPDQGLICQESSTNDKGAIMQHGGRAGGTGMLMLAPPAVTAGRSRATTASTFSGLNGRLLLNAKWLES